VVALVIASGDHTPLEHVIAVLPIVGKQRLPNRALILFALSMSLLGAYFLDWLLAHHPSRRQIKVGLIPIVGIFAVALATVATGHPAGGALTPHAGSEWTLRGVLPDLAVSVGIAAAVGGFLLFGGRVSGRRRVLLVTLLVLVDLVSSDVNQSSYAPVMASSLRPADHAIVAKMAGDGRYLVVDPLLRGPNLYAVAEPDLGVFDKLPDAGGYSSLAWGPYAAATGTHLQDGIVPSAISDGTLSALGVTTMFAVQSEVITRVANYTDPPLEVSAGSRVVRWFGTDFTVTSISLASTVASPAALRQLASTLTLLGDDEIPIVARHSISASAGKVTVRYSALVKATGLELGGAGLTTSVAIAPPTVQPEGETPFVTAGPIGSALGDAGWMEVKPVDGFSTFVNPKAAPPYSVAAAGATVRLLSSDPWTGEASVQVTTPQASWLVRSVADIPGWRATVTRAGQVSNAPVESDGLVQRVALPAGTSRVTFFYVAPGWKKGQILALGGALAFAALMIACILSGRRRRPRRRKRDLSEPGAPSLAPA
jgi:hypothetical protein